MRARKKKTGRLTLGLVRQIPFLFRHENEHFSAVKRHCSCRSVLRNDTCLISPNKSQLTPRETLTPSARIRRLRRRPVKSLPNTVDITLFSSWHVDYRFNPSLITHTPRGGFFGVSTTSGVFAGYAQISHRILFQTRRKILCAQHARVIWKKTRYFLDRRQNYLVSIAPLRNPSKKSRKRAVAVG